MSPKYYLEIDTNGAECSGYEDRYYRVCYGTIVTEGGSLEECLDNASVDLVDQDGGTANVVEAEKDWMQDMIEKAFMAKYPPPKEPAFLSDEWTRRMEKANAELSEVREINRRNGWGR